jgi:hypothetical protein
VRHHTVGSWAASEGALVKFYAHVRQTYFDEATGPSANVFDDVMRATDAAIRERMGAVDFEQTRSDDPAPARLAPIIAEEGTMSPSRQRVTAHGRALTGMDGVSVPERRGRYEGDSNVPEITQVPQPRGYDEASHEAAERLASWHGFGVDARTKQAAAITVRRRRDTVLVDLACISGIFGIALVVTRAIAV